jgi:hypothetical protein
VRGLPVANGDPSRCFGTTWDWTQSKLRYAAAMPIEEVGTDEKLERSGPRPKDFDSQMMLGCTGFVLTSIVGFLLSVWPFIAFSGLERFAVLEECALFGLVPAAILGAFATRRFGVAGACGFVGSALAFDVFLYLRFEEIHLGAEARRIPPPDYPMSLAWLAPVGWALFVLFVALLAIPKSEIEP